MVQSCRHYAHIAIQYSTVALAHGSCRTSTLTGVGALSKCDQRPGRLAVWIDIRDYKILETNMPPEN